MSEIDRLRDNRARAARFYAANANRLADALEADPTANTLFPMQACSRAWNDLVHADQAVQRWIVASDSIDDFYRKQAALDGAAEGTVQ